MDDKERVYPSWPGDGATLAITKFQIASKYIITSTKDGKKIIEAAEDSYYRCYSPLEVVGIYSQLAKVKTDKDLLKFASQYGLLGISERQDIPISLVGIASSYRFTHWDYVSDSLKVAEEIRQLLDIVNGSDLKNVLGYVEELWPEWLPVLKDKDSRKLARAYVALRVSSKLGGVRLSASFTEKGEVAPGTAYYSLYDAVWHQFYIDLVGHVNYKQCPYCHSWHTGKGKFCPAPPFYSRSPCQNAYAVKKCRNKK